MIKSQSKGRIPVLKNGAEAEKQQSGATGKTESVRPKLFGGKKTDKSKEGENTKSKPVKVKTKEDKSKQKLKVEESKEKEKKRVKKEKEKEKVKEKEKEKVKETAEKEKKKMFKPAERTQSKLLSKTKAKSSKPVPAGEPVVQQPVVELTNIAGEDGIIVIQDGISPDITSSATSTPSPNEPQYDVVGSPIRKADNFLQKYQIKGHYLEPKPEISNSSSDSSGTQPTPDSVQSFDVSADSSERKAEASDQSSSGNPSPQRGDNSSGQYQFYEDIQQIPKYEPREVMSDDQEQQYDHVGYGECPRSPSARSDPGVLEDTPAKPNRIRYGPGRRQVPRRHTLGSDLPLGGTGEYEDPEDKRAAFMDLLANRYPAYADRIYSGTQSEVSYPVKQSRIRDPRRRQTTIVTYHPNRSLEYDDSGTMSDIDAPINTSFSRGGFQRSSMPIVRTPSSTLDRTLGLAFLVFGTETKKCLLPNEITTLDTVRALFVHHFPERLTFQYLESPRQKIYILDPKTNIFFQLDDLHEIRDRTVLRIHECDSDKPQKLKEQPKVRGRAISAVPERPCRPAYTEPLPRRDDVPMQPYHTYMVDGDTRVHPDQWEVERRSRSRSRTPDPERPKSVPARTRYSPDRHTTPERGLLGTIPEHHQIQNGRDVQNGGHYEPLYLQRAQSQPTSPTRDGRAFSPNPSGYENPYYGYHGPPPSDYYPQHNGGQSAFVSKPKRPPANAAPQYSMPPPPQAEMRNGHRHAAPNRHSLSFVPMTTARPPHENYYQQVPARHRQPANDDSAFLPARTATPVPEYYHSKKRMDKMEVQLANLAAWVQKSATDSLGRASSRSNSSNASESTETLPISSSSSLSGLSDSGSSQRTIVTCSREMKLSMVAIREQTCNLRLELRGLRRAQQVNYEDICEAIADTLNRIKKVLIATPGASNQLIRKQRYDIDGQHNAYMTDQQRLEQELSDLEQSVEELRNDVVTRQCRVQMTDIESMALLLSNITKSIADLKTRFPCLQEKLKYVMAGEMEVVVHEEQFLIEEPDRIDSSLKRCKKLTGTLYTLKRLASVQDHRPINIPSVASKINEPSNEDKHGVLENIRAIVPNHTTRLNSLEEAESSRERKRKIIKQKESLKFGKSLELASKSLKPAEDKQKSEKGVNSSKANTFPLDYGHAISLASKVPPVHSQTASLPPASPSLIHTSVPSSSSADTMPLSSMAIPASPTTIANQDVIELNNQKLAARAAFFSSMSSPETSPNSPGTGITGISSSPTMKTSDIATSSALTSMDYVVKFSPAQISSIKSNSKAITTTSSGTGTVLSIRTSESANANMPNMTTSNSPTIPTTKEQLSPQSKQGSSIPRRSGKISPSQDSLGAKSDGDVPIKGKKPPPPPPPRKSSRLPLGSHNINGTVSPVRPFSPENSQSEIKATTTDVKHPIVYSSTPKPLPAKKPVSKYQKDIVAGIYANMNRPDLQCQQSPPEHEQMPSTAETKTNVLYEREGSSDSTSSSASLDSQIGSSVLRDSEMTGSNGSLSKKRKPKPNPPERRSSLLSKSPTRTTSDSKTQLLHDQTILLNQLQEQQNALIQQHNNLVRSTTSPPPTLPKPKSPSSPSSPVSQNGKK